MAHGLILADLVAHDFDFPASAFASPDKTYGRETLVFPSGSETVAISRPPWMPLGRTGVPLRVVVCWKAPSNPSGKTVGWKVEFENYDEGVDLASDRFHTAGAQSGSEAVSATAHAPVYTDIDFSNADAAAIEPGSMFRIRITRVGTGANDYSGNAELLGVLIYEYDPPD